MARDGLVWLSVVASIVASAACGGGGGGGSADAPTSTDVGFDKPTKVLAANQETGANQFTTVGSADLSCLGSADDDQPTTIDVTLTGQVIDFMTRDPLAGAQVVAFAGNDTGSALGEPTTSDGSGDTTLTIPTGTTRFGVEMTASGYAETLILNQQLDPSTATQMLDPPQMQIVSITTRDFIPADLTGNPRVTGTGILAGLVRDCGSNTISNFVVAVSSTSGSASLITGADTFFFDSAADLPEKHDEDDAATADGQFTSINVPPQATAFVQAWGYVTDADLANDQLTLISELAIPVLADTVVTASFEPLRAQ